MREYFADVERTWEDLILFAEDFRAIPGAVIVMGHVEGKIAGEPVKRRSVWTWKVKDGKATECKAVAPPLRLDSVSALSQRRVA